MTDKQKRVIAALEGSVQKWYGVLYLDGEENGPDDCTCCVEFFNSSTCDGCPIKAATGISQCGATPYREWRRVCDKYSVYDSHKLAEFSEGSQRNEARCAALAEYEFLVRLLAKIQGAAQKKPEPLYTLREGAEITTNTGTQDTAYGYANGGYTYTAIDIADTKMVLLTCDKFKAKLITSRGNISLVAPIDPTEVFKKAQDVGEPIEFHDKRDGTRIWVCPKEKFTFYCAPELYRIVPTTDPLYEVKKAFCTGKEVEVKDASGYWTIFDKSTFSERPSNYRIMSDKIRELRAKYAAGVPLECSICGVWNLVTSPTLTWNLSEDCYRIQEKVDPRKEFKDAFAAGKKLEYKRSNTWVPLPAPKWNGKPENYRIVDPYQKVKDALNAGRPIQWFDGRVWSVTDAKGSLGFHLPPECYRVVGTEPTKENTTRQLMTQLINEHGESWMHDYIETD